jgi:hypothetical protein
MTEAPKQKRENKDKSIMVDDRARRERLLQYLLWGMTNIPARFISCSDFITWASDLGFDSDECRAVWNDLQTVFNKLWGNPFFVEVKQVT